MCVDVFARDQFGDEISAALFNRFMQQRPFPFGILLLIVDEFMGDYVRYQLYGLFW